MEEGGRHSGQCLGQHYFVINNIDQARISIVPDHLVFEKQVFRNVRNGQIDVGFLTDNIENG